MAVERLTTLLPSSHIPQAHRFIGAARGQQFAVRTERHPVHRAGVAGKLGGNVVWLSKRVEQCKPSFFLGWARRSVQRLHVEKKRDVGLALLQL